MIVTLPYSEEAEKAVLGVLLLDHENIYEVMEVIGPEDFYLSAHQIIFQAILDVFEKGKAFDTLTIKEYLRTHGKLEAVGGEMGISSMVDDIPMLRNVKDYARIVVDKANLRRLMQMASKILEQGSDAGVSSEELLQKAEKEIFSMVTREHKRALVPVQQELKNAIQHIADRMTRFQTSKELPGVASGFRDMEQFIPGFQPGELIIVAARPSVGKTSFALSLVEKMAYKDKIVAIFSLEMPHEQIVLRLLCADAQVNVKRVREGSIQESEYVKLTQSMDRLAETQIYVDDSPILTVVDLKAKLMKLKMEIGLDVVIVDYLQLMEGRGESNRVQEISGISRGLKILAKELNVPFIVLSQLNRAIEKRSEGRPQLSDLRESGAIEQDADIVSFLHRKSINRGVAVSGSLTEIELIIAKNRNGPIGTIMLAFLNEYAKFENFLPVDQR